MDLIFEKPKIYYDSIDGAIIGTGETGKKGEFLEGKKGSVEVTTNDLQYSTGLIYGQGFSSCVCVALYSPTEKWGGLAHINMETNPFTLFGGTPSKGKEGIREVYSDPSLVRAIQISHWDRACINDQDMAASLVEQGLLEHNIRFEHVFSHPDKNTRIRRFIGFDVTQGRIFVFYENKAVPDILQFSKDN